jgi:hypothetical protein
MKKLGMPLQWHRRQAIVLASQLPDNTGDATLVLAALTELVQSYLVANEMPGEAPLGANVLPFAG